MKIIEINENLSTIFYSSLDYKYKPVFVVVYGLSSKQFEDEIEAYKYLDECKCHALGYYISDED